MEWSNNNSKKSEQNLDLRDHRKGRQVRATTPPASGHVSGTWSSANNDEAEKVGATTHPLGDASRTKPSRSSRRRRRRIKLADQTLDDMLLMAPVRQVHAEARGDSDHERLHGVTDRSGHEGLHTMDLSGDIMGNSTDSGGVCTSDFLVTTSMAGMEGSIPGADQAKLIRREGLSNG